MWIRRLLVILTIQQTSVVTVTRIYPSTVISKNNTPGVRIWKWIRWPNLGRVWAQYNVMSSNPVWKNKYGTVASEKYLPARKSSGLLHNGKHTFLNRRSISRNSPNAAPYNPFKITPFDQITHKWSAQLIKWLSEQSVVKWALGSKNNYRKLGSGEGGCILAHPVYKMWKKQEPNML